MTPFFYKIYFIPSGISIFNMCVLVKHEGSIDVIGYPSIVVGIATEVYPLLSDMYFTKVTSSFCI